MFGLSYKEKDGSCVIILDYDRFSTRLAESSVISSHIPHFEVKLADEDRYNVEEIVKGVRFMLSKSSARNLVTEWMFDTGYNRDFSSYTKNNLQRYVVFDDIVPFYVRKEVYDFVFAYLKEEGEKIIEGFFDKLADYIAKALEKRNAGKSD